jgi:hypothetical protein
MADVVTFKRTSSNPQHTTFGPTSISGGLLPDEQNRMTFYSFFDDSGEPGNLEIPAGGELELNLDNPFHAQNYDLFKRLNAAGQIPIQLGLKVQHRGDALRAASQKRILRRQAEDLLEQLETTSREEFLGVAIRLGMGDVEDASIEEVRQFLFEKAEQMPDKLIAELSNPDKELFYLIYKATGSSITQREGAYYFGNQLLGYTVENAVVTLKNNKNLLAGLKSDLDNRIQPSRVMPTVQMLEEDDEETSRLETLKSNPVGLALPTEEALKHGIATKQIQVIPLGKGKVSWDYKGIEIGTNEAQAFSFLDGNESVRAAISAIKLL